MEDQKKSPRTIWQRLAAAQLDVKVIEKTDEMRVNGKLVYKFVSTDRLISEGKKVLAKHGLMLVHTGSEQVNQSSSGGTQIIRHTYQLVSVETGESLELSRTIPIAEAKGRTWDKASLIGSTQGLKDVIRGTLLVQRVDQGDPDALNDQPFNAVEIEKRLKKAFQKYPEQMVRIIDDHFNGQDAETMTTGEKQRLVETAFELIKQQENKN